MMLYILSEPIHTGKTTVLKAWTEERTDVGGFLSPDHEDLRQLFRLSTKEVIPFEIKDPKNEVVQSIGKFHFYNAAFAQAIQWVKEDLKNPEIQWIIIDEMGKLELLEKGFHTLLPLIKDNSQLNYILVVRESLLSEIIAFYELVNPKIIRIKDLSSIS